MYLIYIALHASALEVSGIRIDWHGYFVGRIDWHGYFVGRIDWHGYFVGRIENHSLSSVGIND